MDSIQTVFSIIILILSVIIHEVSHGYMANYLGDPTAKYAGRLTLNPLKHIDLFGSIILPFLLMFSGVGLIFGWAKPVPYNPYNLGNKKSGDLLVAIAGPASNLGIAVFFGLLLIGVIALGLASQAVTVILGLIVYINVLLAIFNLIPIPPLDGSKVALFFLPLDWKMKIAHYENYSFFILILFILFGWQYISPLIRILSYLITGVVF